MTAATMRPLRSLWAHVLTTRCDGVMNNEGLRCSHDTRKFTNRFLGPWQIVLLMLALQAVWLKSLAETMSPTLDEPAGVAAGVAALRYGDFGIYRTSGPLTHLLAAMSLTGMDLDTRDLRRPYPGMLRFEFTAGHRFIKANRKAIRRIFTRSRYMMIPIALLGGVFVYLLSSRIFGAPSGLLSLALWVGSPTILGHGSLVSADVAAAVATLAATYCAVEWCHCRDGLWGAAAGSMVAVGCFAKSTCLLILPALGLAILLAVMARRSDGRWRLGTGKEWLAGINFLATMTLTWVISINVLYLFTGTFKPLGDYDFFSHSLTGSPQRHMLGNRFAGGPISWLPVPLPEPFVSGIDLQKSDLERKTRNYLAGEWKVGGWWYYYL